ncbi:MAG: hypothetical protein BMS9Abin39_0660 [Ignavibacteria bacterium]|nr:MAG: hypothetical protein BMS9Abin39_0660 [Ignavibacteria bacterium]
MVEVKVTDAESFSGTLNGDEFNDPIRYGESKDIETIVSGDKNFTLTINWNDINKINEIKPSKYKLPGNDNVTVLYVHNNAAVPFMVSDGKLIITESNGNQLKGTLDFSVNAGGLPKEMGGTETRLSNGNFEIKLKK